MISVVPEKKIIDTKETVIACWPLYISIYAFLTYHTTETPINCKKNYSMLR